ncbi:MAG TPA: hypothetical protein PLZ75_03700 [Bacteroidales bacterium]|jgi:hypothetical protein|nr:hypothetical protein [Bacteroidales bacterium]HQH23126.1 hypothetical protein [Bacteroidales bacterium]HQJ81016.1 hypothetical protein [Bacteroidales bacterium]
MTRIKILLQLSLLFISVPAFNQEDGKKIAISGYLSSVQSVMFDTLKGPFVNDYILHNRLNFKSWLNDHITFAAEFRNRLFTGDMAKAGKTYAVLTGSDDGFVDMSWNLISGKSFFFNTTIDRLWVDISYEKFQVCAGRQRINWGQALVWNPNDIFNTYSFFDVDYIERPGCDAVRLQYYPSWSSALELAVSAGSEKDITAAGLFRFSRWGYDIQFLAGYSNSSDIVAGAGWSGPAGSFSFRGETTWFRPAESFLNSRGTILVTAGVDRIFSDNSVVQLQMMYCNDPQGPGTLTKLLASGLSARNLAFSKFTLFGQCVLAATPLLNTGLSSMWFPDLKGFFAGPSLEWSMAQNVDFSFIWQHFNGKTDELRSRINLMFLKFRYSF